MVGLVRWCDGGRGRGDGSDVVVAGKAHSHAPEPLSAACADVNLNIACGCVPPRSDVKLDGVYLPHRRMTPRLIFRVVAGGKGP